MNRKTIVITEDCMSCGMCLEMCPVEAIEILPNTIGYSQAIINPDKCVQCGFCLTIDCPAEAIKEVE